MGRGGAGEGGAGVAGSRFAPHQARDFGAEAFEEAGFAELFGVPADGGGVPCVGGGLCHGVGQRGGGVFREEVAGLSGEYGFEEAAAAVCDDWFSACLGFEGDDAEVFFAGENQEAAAAVQGADVFVGDASDKFDVGGGGCLWLRSGWCRC